MNRLLLVTGAAVGACAIAVPAAAGLSGNPSFSQHVPVRVPGSATIVSFDDHGGATSTPRTPDVSPTSTSTGTSRSSTPRSSTPRSSTPRHTGSRPTEPGDDRGRRGSSAASATRTEPGDDRGTHAEPGDDRSTHAEPGDDNRRHRGGRTTPATASVPSHGHGTDDATTRHGGKHGRDD